MLGQEAVGEFAEALTKSVHVESTDFNYAKFLDGGYFSDFTLVLDGKRFPVHRLI